MSKPNPKTNRTLEQRHFKLELRDASDPQSREVRGLAVVYDEPADLGGFTEIIRPEALDAFLAKRSNVRLIHEHDLGKLLSTTEAGSLTLENTERGLAFRATIAKTTDGDNALELIRGGELRGCSFGFWTAEGGDTITRSADGAIVREIHAIEEMPEITLTCYPVYDQTEVSARSIDKAALEAVEVLKARPTVEQRRRRLQRLKAAA